jgi:Tfp pilus assembly protein PilF
VWHDSDTLWRHTLAVDPNCSVCHYNFGQYLRNGGKAHLAVGEFSRAAELRPSLRHVAVYRANRGLAYLELGSVAIANQELAALQITSPQFAEQVRPAFIVDW